MIIGGRLQALENRGSQSMDVLREISRIHSIELFETSYAKVDLQPITLLNFHGLGGIGKTSLQKTIIDKYAGKVHSTTLVPVDLTSRQVD